MEVNYVLINFIIILVALLWLGFSGFAVMYWMKTPKDSLRSIAQKDGTKAWLWWYGFYFTIYLSLGFFASFVGVIAILLSRGL